MPMDCSYSYDTDECIFTFTGSLPIDWLWVTFYWYHYPPEYIIVPISTWGNGELVINRYVGDWAGGDYKLHSYTAGNNEDGSHYYEPDFDFTITPPPPPPEAPPKAINPIPADGAVDVSKSITTFSWEIPEE